MYRTAVTIVKMSPDRMMIRPYFPDSDRRSIHYPAYYKVTCQHKRKLDTVFLQFLHWSFFANPHPAVSAILKTASNTFLRQYHKLHSAPEPTHYKLILTPDPSPKAILDRRNF